MERAKLLNVLKLASAGLSKREYLPIFSCFCFNTKTVTTFNDVLAIEVPCDLAVDGAVHGSTLLSWLSNSKAHEVEVSQEKRAVFFKAGRSKWDTTVLRKKDFAFELPEEQGAKCKLKKSHIAAFSRATAAMGRDVSTAWQAGITVTFGKFGCIAYATNNTTAVATELGLKFKGLKVDSFLMPPAFCDELTSLASSLDPEYLIVYKRVIEARFTNGLRLFSKLGRDPQAVEYEKMFSQDSITKQGKKNACPLPPGFADSLSRAAVVLDSAEDKLVTMKVKDGKMFLSGTGKAGQIKDVLKFGDHPDVVGEFAPAMLQDVLPYVDRLAVLDKLCLCVRGKGVVYLVSLAHEA